MANITSAHEVNTAHAEAWVAWCKADDCVTLSVGFGANILVGGGTCEGVCLVRRDNSIRRAVWPQGGEPPKEFTDFFVPKQAL